MLVCMSVMALCAIERLLSEAAFEVWLPKIEKQAVVSAHILSLQRPGASSVEWKRFRRERRRTMEPRELLVAWAMWT